MVRAKIFYEEFSLARITSTFWDGVDSALHFIFNFEEVIEVRHCLRAAHRQGYEVHIATVLVGLLVMLLLARRLVVH